MSERNTELTPEDIAQAILSAKKGMISDAKFTELIQRLVNAYGNQEREKAKS